MCPSPRTHYAHPLHSARYGSARDSQSIVVGTCTRTQRKPVYCPRDTSQVPGEVALCWARSRSGHEHRGIPLACCRPLSWPLAWPLAWLLRHGHRLLPACCRGGAQAPCPGSLLKRREEPIADLDADGGDVITVITLLLAPLGRSCLDELRDRLLMRAHTPIRPAGAQSRPSGRHASERARKGRTARASPTPRLPRMSWSGQAGALGGRQSAREVVRGDADECTPL